MQDTRRKQAVIFASRPISAGMRRYVGPGAFLAGADAGWQNARQLGYTVHLALGDFDSSQPPQGAGEVLRLPPEKDDTDTHFAARELLARGYRDFVLLGLFGGRRDHEMANYQTLLFLAKQGARVLAADDGVEIRCVGPGTLRLPQNGWRWLSVFAAGGPALGVALEGVKYPLRDYAMLPEFPIGTSNEFAAAEAVVHCREGYLYVMVSE